MSDRSRVYEETIGAPECLSAYNWCRGSSNSGCGSDQIVDSNTVKRTVVAAAVVVMEMGRGGEVSKTHLRFFLRHRWQAVSLS